ncbi:class E sortase [Actinomadura parmotrematis]|uniref:Class E sortase n=1 Tax=Actinomadura parmotrematis TaxID=2864039 RepID=A0ABS7FYK3_9ACTN|nr:class E sortase [Actinomadura parmotrematis]MBW8484734.1 class E sortase [Actinomadura parmotrematis]
MSHRKPSRSVLRGRRGRLVLLAAGGTAAAALAAPAALAPRTVPAAPAAARPVGAVAPVLPVAARDRDGEPYALMTFPRLSVSEPVREGVTESDLWRGVGHYPGTAQAGETGNAVFLGHRTQGAAAFARISALRRGDRIVVRQQDASFTYRVTGRRIISPRTRSVLAPVRFRPGSTPHEAVLTLITCHPKGSDRQRLTVFADLVETTGTPRTAPPAGR